jgi:NADP-dependent 3-hydroxy acid dehydrogenase YdfG
MPSARLGYMSPLEDYSARHLARDTTNSLVRLLSVYNVPSLHGLRASPARMRGRRCLTGAARREPAESRKNSVAQISLLVIPAGHTDIVGLRVVAAAVARRARRHVTRGRERRPLRHKRKQGVGMSGRLAGNVALVTGASSGIGEATALALAAEGARVAAAARRKDHLEELVKRIQDRGGQAMPLVVDIADDAQVHEMVRRTRDTWGRVDILVNDAGVAQAGPIAGAKTEDWREMVNVNLLGLMYATHAVLPLMQAQGRGHIVNISSKAGRIALAGLGVYSATKWGVNAFSEALRQEVAPEHIRVTLIEPGAVATPMREGVAVEAVKDQAVSSVLSAAPLSSEDIAAAVVYAVTQPELVDVNELLITPTEEVV